MQNAPGTYCRMLQEHSAILTTFIKLVVFGYSIPSSTKQKSNQIWIPSDKTVWISARDTQNVSCCIPLRGQFKILKNESTMVLRNGRVCPLSVIQLSTDHHFVWPSHQVPSVQGLHGKDYSLGVAALKTDQTINTNSVPLFTYWTMRDGKRHCLI